ncbi:MAG: symmetrical bis(5'-nucleosyl)-tetraphosphatase [Betaproteobacteria bacterium]|nr:symmetrical bis(5'-nucleosyl)-tetraphosphatase [Betaproteobacteria bacterium]
MSVYIIGDVQGCFTPLERLLDTIHFNPQLDQLWFVGDLVNRGSQSLEVLRYIKNLGDSAVTILGNHDLHLLCVAEGYQKAHASDTLDAILEAPDKDDLLRWLRYRPMMHHDQGFTMVHAGLLPQWSITESLSLAVEVEQALRSQRYQEFLIHIYGNKPAYWSDDLEGMERLRVITNAMTRLRLIDKDGKMDFSFKGKIQEKPKGLYAWYEHPNRKTKDDTIVFGHWSALGLHMESKVLALDTGCLWGGCLTALRLHDRKIFQVNCKPEASLKHFMK